MFPEKKLEVSRINYRNEIFIQNEVFSPLNRFRNKNTRTAEKTT